MSLAPPGRQRDGQDKIIVIPFAPGSERLICCRGDLHPKGLHLLHEQRALGQGSNLQPPGLQEPLQAADQFFLRHVPGTTLSPGRALAAGDHHRLQRGRKLRFGQEIDDALADAGSIDDQHRPAQR